MANDSYTQQALAVDPKFLERLRGVISQVAWQIISEDPSTPMHADREHFARLVVAAVDSYAKQFAPWLVMRTNLYAAATSYDFPMASVVTAATDAEIASQLATDWNDIAGIVPPVARR